MRQGGWTQWRKAQRSVDGVRGIGLCGWGDWWTVKEEQPSQGGQDHRVARAGAKLGGRSRTLQTGEVKGLRGMEQGGRTGGSWQACDPWPGWGHQDLRREVG